MQITKYILVQQLRFMPMRLSNLVISSIVTLLIFSELSGQGVYPNQFAPAPDSNMIFISKGSLNNDFEYEYLDSLTGSKDSLIYSAENDSLYLHNGTGYYLSPRIFTENDYSFPQFIPNPRKWDMWFAFYSSGYTNGLHYYDGSNWQLLDGDNDPQNEIQDLSYDASTRYLRTNPGNYLGGITIPLFSQSATTAGMVNGSNAEISKFLRGDNTWQSVVTTEVDGSTSNELQTLSADSTATTIGITASGNNSRVHFSVLKSEVDGSITNEKIDSFGLKTNGQLRLREGGTVWTVNSLLYGGSSLGANYLPIWSGGQSLTNYWGSGSVKVLNGLISNYWWKDIDTLNVSDGIVIATSKKLSSITNNSGNWNTAYNDKINSLAFSGTTTKTLTLTQQDGGTVTNTFTDIDTNSGGTVTSIATSSPITGGTITGTGTIGIQTASGSQAGALSSTDWTTFNSKIGGSGLTNRIPYFSTANTLTSASTLTRNATTGDIIVNNATIGLGGGSVVTNIALGAYALASNTSGSNNICVGYYSMVNNTSGNGNTSFGSSSLFGNSTGSYNVAVGYQAGYQETGSQKLYIENSNSSSPLIGGNFSTDRVGINTAVANLAATLHVTGNILSTDLASGYNRLVYANSAGAQLTTTGTGYLKGNGTTFTYDNSTFQTTTLTDGKIRIGNGSNLAAEQTMSGDATMTNTGVVTITPYVEKATSAATQSITDPANGWIKLTLDANPINNTKITYSNTNDDLTVTTAGNYKITWSCNLIGTVYLSDFTAQFKIYKNGSALTNIINKHYIYNADDNFQHSEIYTLAANDYIDIRANTSSSAKQYNISQYIITIEKVY